MLQVGAELSQLINTHRERPYSFSMPHLGGRIYFTCLLLDVDYILNNHHLKTADFYTNTRIVDSELNYIRILLRVFLVCKLNMRSFGSVMCYEQLMLPLEHQGVSLMLVCCVGKARWCIWQSCQLKDEGKSSLKFLYFSVHY